LSSRKLVVVHEHRGDYGIDGSFHTISARGQAIGLGAQAAALAEWAGIGWARGKRVTAKPAGGSAVALISTMVRYVYATRSGIDEAVRVLRPGGRLAIAGLSETRQHAIRLREMGWRNVKRRNLGWRMWYGGPWISMRLVTATKPGEASAGAQGIRRRQS
jgi:hypothetical protein